MLDLPKHAPAINHSKEFRDRAMGFHSNDIESENARLKRWSRKRYGVLQLSELDLLEYTFMINKCSAMSGIMEGLAD